MTPRPRDFDNALPPVSIVGIGCRLPGATGIEQLWRLLLDGRDATGAPPDGRAGTRHGGYLDDIELFDNTWFAVSDRETAAMDPQQRLAMEVAVEALDDAGVGYRTRGSHAAVIFGACGYDHGITVLGRAGHDAPFAVTGSALSIIANRLSYVLDLHGPSLVVDSACSSSLAAVDLAVRLLADEAVPFAIVGGVNLTTLPHTADYMAESGFLAPDGRSKPFDASADGYTRAEGCAVVILQRSADAVRTGSRVYAEIAGTAVGSDGRSNGLYAPNGRAQQDTLRTAWSCAGLDPSTAGYLECHGTGTSLGDAVEVAAAAAVVEGAREEPIWIGSVKANIGHLEAAAGVTGLIKTALSIHRGVIPPTISFRTENPLLKLDERGLRVPTEPVDWSRVPVAERRAGVSSFGFGGTNAHAVLRGVAAPPSSHGDDYPVLIAVTGRDDAELRAQALRFAERLEHAGIVAAHIPAAVSGQSLDESSTAPEQSRSASGSLDFLDPDGHAAESVGEFANGSARLIPQAHRAVVLARDRGAAVDRLHALAQGDSSSASHDISRSRRRGGVLFLFSGQGGQYPRMGRALAARHPVFAEALADAADAVAAEGGPRVWTPRHGFTRALTGDAAAESTADSTAFVQPALFVFQVAMAKLLAAWGIHPDAIAGHSLGEIAGAAVGGALSLAQAARIVVHRSRCLARLDGLGAMALLEATPHEAATLVEPMRAEVAIAAVNGPRSVVVSGAPRYVDTLVRRAKRRSIFATRIAVDFAAHSPQVNAVLPPFVDAVGELAPRAPRVPIYSTARRGALITDASMDLEYWAANASGTVELAAAVERAAAEGLSSVVEIAPHPVLISAVREYPDFRDGAHVAAVRDDEAGGFLTCLAGLYAEGRSIDWSAGGTFGSPPRRRWRKRRFPLLTPTTAAVTTTSESDLVTDDLSDHVVHGSAIVPAVFWLRRLLHLAGTWSGGTVLADLVVHERTDLAALPEVSYHGHATTLRAEVSGSSAVPLASARAGGDPTPADIVDWMRVVDANRAARHRMRVVPPGTFYDELRRRRLEYGPCFRVLRAIAVGTDRALGLFDSAELHRTATLDGCLHLLAAAIYDELPDAAVPLPIGIESAWLSTEPNRLVLEAHAVLREHTATGVVGDVIGTDQHGVPCLALIGVRIRFAQLDTLSRDRMSPATTVIDDTDPTDRTVFDGAPRAAFSVEQESVTRNVFHHQVWETCDPATIGIGTSRPTAGRALVVGESSLAIALTRALDATVPTERVAREPDAASPIVAAVMSGRTGAAHTAVVLVWPGPSDSVDIGARQAAPFDHGGDAAAVVGRVLALLQQLQSDYGTASLTVVLPHDNGLDTGASAQTAAVASALGGLVRSLQLESGSAIRLVWSDAEASSLSTLACVVTEFDEHGAGAVEEFRVSGGTLAARRFRPAPLRTTPLATVDPAGTYVVTGGLGALGAVSVRWLLDAGARDVVVLTRSPRPVPPLLDGLEHRIVVARCDAADRGELANALNDIRECGSTIRGIVHAAGALEDAPFDAVTPEQVARMFAPKLTAANNLIELSAADPTDFILLFSSATGAMGAPGQAAYAAANCAMDALARTHPRRVLSIGWGVWETGLAEAAGGAPHLRRAGIAAFDIHSGARLLSRLLRVDGPYVLALDHTPTADTSPLAARLTNLLPAVSLPDVGPTFAPTVPHAQPPRPETDEPLAVTIRRVLARTLDLPAERIGPTVDFNELGLSSLLAIELRRNLESRLRIRISTAELFQHSTITSLGAALVDRVAAATNTSESP